MTNITPFNPLDRDNLADSINRALLTQPPQCLDHVPSFAGAGIYALYYRGDYPPYRPFVAKDKDGEDRPIYVGKAVPKGGRMGGTEDKSIASDALVTRLRKHARKIHASAHLEKKHFDYKYLVVSDAFIGLCEVYLIGKKLPLWNTAITGFGNNALGSGRLKQRPSLWDILHPPKTLGPAGLKSEASHAEVLRKVSDYFSGLIPDPVDDDGDQDSD